MKIRLMLAAAVATVSAVPAAAQSGMIAPGMTPAQVRDVFGAPARTREAGAWTYWFYANGCPVRCGSDDVVFFQNDRVVTAVLRTHRRAVSGPAAPTALERAGGDIDADAIRARAAEEGSAPSPSRPIRVRGRSRDAGAEPDENAPPARVGRIHVESGGRVIDRQTTSPEPTPEPGSTIIRTPAGAQDQGVDRRGVRNPPGTAGDSVQGAPATAVDDSRAAREGEIRRNTLPNQPDTMQARRTNREKSVTPRIVPRP
jgi:hypothetical protein